MVLLSASRAIGDWVPQCWERPGAESVHGAAVPEESRCYSLGIWLLQAVRL